MVDFVTPPPSLRRDLGVAGAVMMGLGSIIGTGVFVSIGIAASIAGPSVILAIAIAAALALCNALSSAQLAASHPVSGGTYEYGYRYLSPSLGFTAGWMFLCAKTASAATAALGFAGYALRLLDQSDARAQVILALAIVMAMTIIVLTGVKRTTWLNATIVIATLAALLTFIIAGAPTAVRNAPPQFQPFMVEGVGGLPALLHASALMFVAFTGYGRIATMGEEVRDPQRTIPHAIVITVLVSAALYVAVTFVAVGSIGAAALGEAATATAAPLETTARSFATPSVANVVALGAMTAMLGVLLNLILGLSRVMLAMARRGDMPSAAARLNASRTSPTIAVIVVGLLIAGVAAIGSVKMAWSFSAFTVLIYYAITNMAALRLSREDRRFHPSIAWLGLLGCLGLAFWVDARVWAVGLGVLAIGLFGRWSMRTCVTKPAA